MIKKLKTVGVPLWIFAHFELLISIIVLISSYRFVCVETK